MLNNFLDKLSGFFDQRFVIAYLIPILIGLVLSLSLDRSAMNGVPVSVTCAT